MKRISRDLMIIAKDVMSSATEALSMIERALPSFSKQIGIMKKARSQGKAAYDDYNKLLNKFFAKLGVRQYKKLSDEAKLELKVYGDQMDAARKVFQDAYQKAHDIDKSLVTSLRRLDIGIGRWTDQILLSFWESHNDDYNWKGLDEFLKTFDLRLEGEKLSQKLLRYKYVSVSELNPGDMFIEKEKYPMEIVSVTPTRRYVVVKDLVENKKSRKLVRDFDSVREIDRGIANQLIRIIKEYKRRKETF